MKIKARLPEHIICPACNKPGCYSEKIDYGNLLIGQTGKHILTQCGDDFYIDCIKGCVVYDGRVFGYNREYWGTEEQVYYL